ncbi:MAG TPA: hypothetical protein VK590_11910 [Saprospiraceae bacterium]|nr:hypothetical protein [Saprospiraceae bacterium]
MEIFKQMKDSELISGWNDLISQSNNKLNALNNVEAAFKQTEDKWSKKELLGHLCDSAINNYTRVIKIQLGNNEHIIEKYAQNDWVRLANYQNREWESIINEWLLLNNVFIELVKNTAELCFEMTGYYDGQKLSLSFIVSDYIEHMKHHLNQILDTVN